MNIIDLANYEFSNNRRLFRQQLVNLFLDETPGTGKKNLASRNRYIVKIIENYTIYLQRPAQFNNGFDFTLNVSNINFNDGYYNDKGILKRSTTRPSHQHILDDLNKKKQENPELYQKLIEEVTKIYNCEEFNNEFEFESGYNVKIILECIKWLFAEQDITYWHYSGRSMFYNSILNI